MRPQAALAADDAGDDLRRGGGGVDDVDRRRRAAAGAGVHRAARRAQPDRRSAGGHRFPGLSEGAQDLAGPDRARSARHPRERARASRASTARKRYVPQKLVPKPQREMPQVYGVEPELPRHRRRCAVASRPLLRRRRRPRRRRRRACSARARRTNLFGAQRPDRRVREGQRAVVPRDRRRSGPQVSSQTDVAGRAGAGPQQPDLRAGRRRRSCGSKTATAGSRTRSTASTCRWPMPTTSCATADVVRGILECVASRHRRLLADRARGAARRAAAHAADLRLRHGGAGVDLAARRRHRHHEHHAGERARADARDRHPPRRRRRADRHRPAVPRSRR